MGNRGVDARLRDKLPLLETDRRNSLANAIFATAHEPLIVLDPNLRVVAASGSFCRLFRIDAAKVRARGYHEFCSGQLHSAALRRLLEEAVSSDVPIDAYELDIDVPEIGRRDMLLSAHRLLDGDNPEAALLVELQDVTPGRDAVRLKDALLQAQEVLLLEVQHRVANSLQIIASLLLLKARRGQSQETRVHLRDAHHRVLSVATVQRQLLTSGLDDEIELGPYLSVLCEGLANSMIADSRVRVTSSSTGGMFKSENAVSCGLIVTELVINALKHAFPNGRKGRIDVAFSGDGSDWRLSVSDNGVGRQSNPVQPTHVGLGTSIVEALARQLRATVEIAACSPGTATVIIHAAG
jgi:two-component sensor histidine kinase